MSYQQPPVGVPPPQGYPYKGEYPPPGYPAPQAYQPQPYPPPQYAQPPPQSNQHAGCLEGCLAGLCCCCVLEACF